jgi:hypothetical protein
MVLPRSKSELRLEKQLLPDYFAALQRRRDSASDSCLVVVPTLVSGIDTPESLPQGELGESLRRVLFPGRAVK